MASRGAGTAAQILEASIGGIGIFLPGILLIYFVYPVWEELKDIRAVRRPYFCFTVFILVMKSLFMSRSRWPFLTFIQLSATATTSTFLNDSPNGPVDISHCFPTNDCISSFDMPLALLCLLCSFLYSVTRCRWPPYRMSTGITTITTLITNRFCSMSFQILVSVSMRLFDDGRVTTMV